MRILRHVVGVIVLLIVVSMPAVAQDFTTWTSETFSAPFPVDGVMSNIIPNPQGFSGV